MNRAPGLSTGPLTGDLLARARRVIPGGTLEELTLPPEVQVVPARGRGSRLWDVHGREYVDYVLGGGALLLGHAHPAVVEAATAQARDGSAFAMLTEAAVELAEALVEAIPCAEQVLFAATGAEATHFALRLARAATGREKILKVVIGFRLALGGAQETYGVIPDLAAYGKVGGGGYPLAVVAGPADLLGRADPRASGPAAVYLSGSQFGNAVAVRAALATVRCLREPGVYRRLADLGTGMQAALQPILDAEGMPGRVLAHGPIWHVLPGCTETGPFTDHQAALRATAAGRHLVTPLACELVRRGALAFPRPGRGYIRGYLSLAHTKQDLVDTAEALRGAMRAVAAAG